jgi:hypothetical protein
VLVHNSCDLPFVSADDLAASADDLRLPEFRISSSDYPELAENIRNAQLAGHPRVLTHGGNQRANRRAATAGVPEIPGTSRDEYPFASSIEGGESAWVGHVPTAPLNQNSAQGGLLSLFVRRTGLRPGDRYRVVIVP